MSKLTQSAQWLALQSHQRKMTACSMQEMFAIDRDRFNKYTLEI